MKKKVLAAATAMCVATSLLPIAAQAAEYKDTTDHWAKDSINRWSEYGVVNGAPGGNFNPEGEMTRAEAAQVFANLLKLSKKADISGYTDVPADAWYADAIALCAEKGILNGVGGNQMDPTGTITREMFFVMFARALGIQEETKLENTTLVDTGSISSWATGSVYALINNNYVKGTAASELLPLDDINRASVMALMDQSIVAYAVSDGNVEVNGNGIVLVLADNVTITGKGNVSVTAASEGSKIAFKNFTGNVTLSIMANNVNVTNAPAGTDVVVAEGVSGATVNGRSVSANSDYTVSSGSTGGSSSSGGSGTGSTGGDTTTTGGTGTTGGSNTPTTGGNQTTGA